MSKSGLFAHFGSREELLLAVLEHGQRSSREVVFEPALAKLGAACRACAPCSSDWLDWTDRPSLPGGCPMIGGAIEFDDRPGPVRDMLAIEPARLDRDASRRAVRQAIEEGQLTPGTEPEQIASRCSASRW